jgi:hypothetical protein
LTCQLCGLRRLNARLHPFQEEAFNAFVAEALDHRKTVSRNDTRVNLSMSKRPPRSHDRFLLLQNRHTCHPWQ